MSGRGGSKGSDLSATEGVHLKNSKKHMKPGVGDLGRLSHHRGLGKQELWNQETPSVSPVAKLPRNEGAPHVCISVRFRPHHTASRVGFFTCQMG